MAKRTLKRSDLRPGDILLTSNVKGVSFWIKLGALLKGNSAAHNHVVVVSHVDDAGTYWGIEARSGGVGWVDLAQYMNSPRTTSNAGLDPDRTIEDREKVVEIVKGMLDKKYDWSAIVELAMRAIHADDLWAAKDFDEKTVPAHFVCSALAAWAYDHVGWRRPNGNPRFVTPGMWDDFLNELEFEESA